MRAHTNRDSLSHNCSATDVPLSSNFRKWKSTPTVGLCCPEKLLVTYLRHSRAQGDPPGASATRRMHVPVARHDNEAREHAAPRHSCTSTMCHSCVVAASADRKPSPLAATLTLTTFTREARQQRHRRPRCARCCAPAAASPLDEACLAGGWVAQHQHLQNNVLWRSMRRARTRPCPRPR